MLLIEQVDRLTRPDAEDWDRLKTKLLGRKVYVVARDLLTSHTKVKAGDEMIMWMMGALNSMMLDMQAAIASKDYQNRRRRTTQGIAKAKERDKLKPQAERVYKGRPANDEGSTAILAMLDRVCSWSEVCAATGTSRNTLLWLVKNSAECRFISILLA